MSPTKFLMVVALSAIAPGLRAQPDDGASYRDFPIVISIQFHALSVPFRDLKSNFTNVGFGLGTETSFNTKHNMIQQVQMVWWHNKAVGNGLSFWTQTAWRPAIGDGPSAELKTGIGYTIAWRPQPSFRLNEGNWVPAGRRGKGMLTIPTGVAVGYQRYTTGAYLSPFVGYQFLILKGYNQSIPLVPETLFQIGSRIHTK